MNAFTEEHARDWLESQLGTRYPATSAVIALLLGNDKHCFTTADGTDIHDLCRPSATVCLTHENETICYGFLDNSLIVVTPHRWEARKAGRIGRIRLGKILKTEILPGGSFMGRKVEFRTSEEKLESGLPRSFGVTIDLS